MYAPVPHRAKNRRPLTPCAAPLVAAKSSTGDELYHASMAPQPPGSEEGDPDQWWFWTEAWQAKEAEADANIAAGRLIRHNSTDEFLAALDEAIARDTR